jgi:hypothetical protein
LAAAHAARTTYIDAELMMSGHSDRSLLVTPTSTEQAAEWESVVWVVGFRASVPFEHGTLDKAIGLYNSADPTLDNQSTEGFVVIDHLGNIVMTGTLDTIDADGTPVSGAVMWAIEDIEQLPAPRSSRAREFDDVLPKGETPAAPLCYAATRVAPFA